MIAFVGISHLSLCTGFALASTNEDILFLDDNESLVNDLNQKKLPIFEPDLNEIWKKNENRIQFSTNFFDLKECDLVYLAKDVPTNHQNEGDYTSTLELLELIKKNIKPQTPLIIHNQVRPGFCRKIQEDFSKIHVPVFYQVEVLIFGQAIHRVLHPERYIIGQSDPVLNLPKTYQRILEKFSCPILKMKYESAELAKLSINIYLCASVSVSNSLSEVAEVVGADWEEIIPVLRLDKRIGQHAYLVPGLGISGGNLERDMIGIKSICQKNSLDPQVIESFINFSSKRKNWALRMLCENVLSKILNPQITILGLAYKKGTTSVKNSPSLELIETLLPFNLKLNLYDPEVKFLEKKYIGPNTKLSFSDPLEAMCGSDAIILMTDWEQFNSISLNSLQKHFSGKIIIDPLGVLKKHSCEKYFHYLRPGVTHA